MIGLESVNKTALVKQSILAVSVSLAYFCIGLVRGWSSPAVPSIHEIVPDLLPTKKIASWASSIPPLGAFFGSLCAAPLMHKIGRKFTVLITSPLWTIAWATIALSQRWEVIMAGRFLSGFCAGLTIPSAQIYVAECSDTRIRGILGSLPSFFMSLGILITFILGKFLSWNILAWFCCGISICLFFTLIFLPESPVWLKTKNQHEQASEAAKWLHLTGFELSKEHKIANTQSTNIADQKPDKLFSKKIIFSRPIMLPLGIGIALLVFQQFSGIDAIIFFTVEIFKNAGSSLNSHDATIIVGFVQVVANLCSLLFVDKYGRKPLLTISGVIMAASTAVMGAAFYINSIGNTRYGFLPLASLIVFMAGFSTGFGVIPFLLIGELFPTQQRSILSSLAGSLNLLIMFVVIKTYHPLEELITTAGTFWMYSVLCVLGVLFVLFFVPETKGKELESIALLFVKHRPSNDKNGQDNVTFTTADENIVINTGEKTKL